MKKAPTATIVIDDSSSDGGGDEASSGRVLSVDGRHTHHASTGRGQMTDFASGAGGDGGVDRMVAPAIATLGGSPRVPLFHDYQDAVKTALAMAASVASASTAAAGADASGADSGMRSGGEAAMKRMTKKTKRSELTVATTRMSKATVDAKAHTRPLVKNSRAWTAAAADGKSAVQAKVQRSRTHSSSSVRPHHQLNGSHNIATSEFSRSTAAAPAHSHYGLHSSEPAMAHSRKTAPGSATMKSKKSSSLHHAAAWKVASGGGGSRSSHGAHKLKQRTQQRPQQRDLIEISSSSSADSSSDEGGSSSSGGGSSSSSDSNIRSFYSHKVRRVDSWSSLASARKAGKARRTSKSAIIGPRGAMAFRQVEKSTKTPGRHTSQLQKNSRLQQHEPSQQTQQPTQHRRRQPAPPLAAARPIAVLKKVTRKTMVLNLSPSSQHTHHDSIYLVSSLTSLSGGSQSSGGDLSKPRTLYYCKKSAPVSTSSAAVFRVQRAQTPSLPSSPLSPPASTLQRSSPPLTTGEKASKRQRRQTAARFHVDSVALNEVQAQERELARFEMEKRQRRSLEQAPFAAMKRASEHTKPSIPWDGGLKAESRDLKHGFSDNDSDFQVIDATAARLAPAKATRKTVVVRPIMKSKHEMRPPSGAQQPSPPASVLLRDDFPDSLSARIARQLEERRVVAQRHLRASVKENISKRAKFLKSLDTSRVVIHPTAYRGIRVPCPPIQSVLSGDALRSCAPPFYSDCDVSLTAYDITNQLEAKCRWLASFGKTKQLMPSLLSYQTETSTSQLVMDLRVQELVESELPRLEHCRERKVNAILIESRRKVSVYKSALDAHRVAFLKAKVHTQRCEMLWSEKLVADHCKKIELLTGSDGAQAMVSFVVARGSTFLQEGHIRRTVMELKKVGTISTSTTCIGVRSNVRVEDDPMVRFSSSLSALTSSDADARRSDITSTSSNFQFSASTDNEVGEYVLRLVVAQLGDSEQVLLSLKNVLGFAQAYMDYMELKKMEDLRKLAARRLAEMRELVIADGGGTTTKQGNSKNHSVATLERLLSCVSMKANGLATLAERLSPPPTFFESHLARQQLALRQQHHEKISSNISISNSAPLSIRAAHSCDELSEIYRGLFCRICYTYDCHEHGSEQPQPARRVDPIHPVVALQTGMKTKLAEKLARARSNLGDHAMEGEAEQGVGLQVVDLTASPRAEARDPTEYFDMSHVNMVTQKISQFLDPVVGCSETCWKVVAAGDSSTLTSRLTSIETTLIQKMRETVGDSACTIASLLRTVPCAVVSEWLAGADGGSDNCGLRDSLGSENSRRTQKHWKQKRGSRSRNSSHHELLQRARNHRLQEKRTEHQYEPCSHDGVCDSMGCGCMKRDHMCDKACSCSRDCLNRYQGCKCDKGRCGTAACPCFAALRECNPDYCVTCGAPELAVATFGLEDGNMHAVPTPASALCCNMHTLIGRYHRKVGLTFSHIHGWGVVALEAIKSGDFVYEYTGAGVSQDEAERRGSVYDKKSVSFLFDLNEDAVVDALRKGNKSKFINHSIVGQNASAKVVRAGGDHHITVWADRDIQCGEELLFNYGYHGETAPAWSQDSPSSSKKTGDEVEIVHT